MTSPLGVRGSGTRQGGTILRGVLVTVLLSLIARSGLAANPSQSGDGAAIGIIQDIPCVSEPVIEEVAVFTATDDGNDRWTFVFHVGPGWYGFFSCIDPPTVFTATARGSPETGFGGDVRSGPWQVDDGGAFSADLRFRLRVDEPCLGEQCLPVGFTYDRSGRAWGQLV